MSDLFAVTGTNDEFFFDGPNREIVVGTGTTNVNMQFVYSFWKQWVLNGNAQYLPAIRVVGGDPLGGDSRVAIYMFLQNGWRFRVPAGGQPEITAEGAVLNTDELDNPFVFDGTLITLEQPIAVQYIASLETNQILDDIAEFRRVTEEIIAPELYYVRNTIEKTLAPNAVKVVSPIINVDYENLTGVTTITTQIDHGFVVGERVHVVGIAMTCNTDQGETIINFPDIELGGGTYPAEADVNQPYTFIVQSTPASNQMVIQVGISSIEHYYTYGGVTSRMTSDIVQKELGTPQFIDSNTFTGINDRVVGIQSTADNISKQTKLIPGLF